MSIESFFREFCGEIKPIFFISEDSIKRDAIIKIYYFRSGLHG
jgi:hypothetical protein